MTGLGARIAELEALLAEYNQLGDAMEKASTFPMAITYTLNDSDELTEKHMESTVMQKAKEAWRNRSKK